MYLFLCSLYFSSHSVSSLFYVSCSHSVCHLLSLPLKSPLYPLRCTQVSLDLSLFIAFFHFCLSICFILPIFIRPSPHCLSLLPLFRLSLPLFSCCWSAVRSGQGGLLSPLLYGGGPPPPSGPGWVTSTRLFSGVWPIFTAVLLLYGTDDLSSGREPHLLRHTGGSVTRTSFRRRLRAIQRRWHGSKAWR
jgi:hypothetical protein